MRSFAQKAPQPTSDLLRRPPVAQSAAISPIQQLQRRVGNQALHRMVQAHAGKAKEDAARDAPVAASKVHSPSIHPVGIGAAEFGRRTGDPIQSTEKQAKSSTAAMSAAVASEAPKIAVRTWAKAPDGTADNRTRVGVCEFVEFSVSQPTADWIATAGSRTANKGNRFFLWRAPEQEGDCDITATFPGSPEKAVVAMNVVAPNQITMTKIAELAFTPGNAGAGMKLKATFHPLNVSFSEIDWKEEGDGPSFIQGYFGEERFAARLQHVPNPNWERIGKDNTYEDTAATKDGTLPRPWSAGTYSWVIPNWYRYASGAHELPPTFQDVFINERGQVTVIKQAAAVFRNP
jgi:hypothetical protein